MFYQLVIFYINFNRFLNNIYISFLLKYYYSIVNNYESIIMAFWCIYGRIFWYRY